MGRISRIHGFAIVGAVLLAIPWAVGTAAHDDTRDAAMSEAVRFDGFAASLDYAPRPGLCRPIGKRRLAATVPQAIEGVRCRAPEAIRDSVVPLQVRYYRFPSRDAMEHWWTSVLATDPGGPWREVGAHEFPIARDSGTLDICTSVLYAQSWGETGWMDADGRSGRLVCWKGGIPSPRSDGGTWTHPTLHWTVEGDLIGAMAAGVDAPSWRWQEQPGWQQADRTLVSGVTAHPPFAASDELHPLPDWVAEGLLPGDSLPRSRPSLEVGVVIPLLVGHCGDAAATHDIDGSWWIPVAAADADGGPIASDRYGPFEAGDRAEFLLVDEVTGQIRLPGGHVIEYERSDRGIKRIMCG
jgi:hypothetical protein